MTYWQAFLDSLATHGGQTVVLLLLMAVGVVAFRNGFPKAEDVILAAFGALLAKLATPRQEPK